MWELRTYDTRNEEEDISNLEDKQDYIAISMRYGEFLCVLCEAVARIRNHKKVEEEDVTRAYELIDYAIQNQITDSSGKKHMSALNQKVHESKFDSRNRIFEEVYWEVKGDGATASIEQIEWLWKEKGLSLESLERIRKGYWDAGYLRQYDGGKEIDVSMRYVHSKRGDKI